jgi:2-keto-3-deoxy-L-rhamnonate aldolase RhmA
VAQAIALPRNHLKEKLARGELGTSMIVRLVRGIEIASIAKTAGFDAVYIDMEHNTFSLDTTSQICMACLNVGITPLVRVPSKGPEWVSRVLDGGALGIIAPHIESADDIRHVVQLAKHAPLGDRSIGGPSPLFQFRSLPAPEAMAATNAATMVVAMIESETALEAAEEIAAVDGVDMLLVGTNDLCSSLGFPGQHDHPRVREAYRHCIDVCQRHGRTLGIGGLASRPALAQELVAMGARYMSVGNDLGFLLAGATAQANALSGA